MGPVTSDAPYAFVSYSSADRARVFGITGVLEAQGVPLWLDRRSISGGRRWTTEIVRGVEDAAVLLVMCSPASVASRNVQQEVQLAWESERRILPVIVEEVQLPAELRYALAGQQWVEVLDRAEQEWLPELLGALRNLGVREQELQQAGAVVEEKRPAEGLLQEKRLHNLPAPRSTFVGRSDELGELERVLQDHRLVTLTGPGGVGKSRLALELAWRLLPSFADGVWLVSLETATDPALVPELVATAVGIRGLPGRPLALQLADRLASKNALLVLDNCEHLLGPCAELAGALTAGGRELRVLATSRELLGTAGEQVIPVPPLQVPAPLDGFSASGLSDSESVQLFSDRARSVHPSFELTRSNAPAIAEVCRTLDGIPLAIELAAARARTLTPHELLSRLENMFGLLRGTDRTALERQRTLQAAVDWSYDSLEENERVLWRRLSVFPETFSLNAVEVVCGFDPVVDYEVLDLLAGLVDKSLVMTARSGDQTRHHLLKTLRRYAADKLRESGEETDLRDRHATWSGEVVRTAAAGIVRTVSLYGPGAESEHRGLLRVEYPSIRAALEHLVASDRAQEALEMAGASGMTRFLIDEHPFEGSRMLQRVLDEAPRDRTETRANALRGLGWLQSVMLQTEQARATLCEAVDVAREIGQPPRVAYALNALGICPMCAGDYQEAETIFQEAVDYVSAHGLTFYTPLVNLAETLIVRGETIRARAILDGARKLIDARSQERGWVYLRLGWIAFWEGELREAGRLADMAVVLPILRLRTEALSLRGASLAQAGNAGQALAALEAALHVSLDSGEMYYLQKTIIWLGFAAAKHGDMRLAVMLFAAAEEAIVSQPMVSELVGRMLEQAQSELGLDEFGSAHTAGRAMSLDQAATYALKWLEERHA